MSGYRFANRDQVVEDVLLFGKGSEHGDRPAPLGDDEPLALLDASQVTAQVLAQITNAHLVHGADECSTYV